MTSFLQWNLNGYFKRLPELKQLISIYHPTVIAIQETHLLHKHKTSVHHYKIFRHDHINPNHNHANGGVALLVSDLTNPQLLHTSSNIQNVAVSARIPQLSSTPITLCSIYIPPSQNISSADLSNLISSLPPPFVLFGDFNAHSHTWGSSYANSHGNVVDQILTSNTDIFLLNNPYTPTHLNSSSGSLSNIDLTLCSTSLAPKLDWAAHHDLCDSDHFPLHISTSGQKINQIKTTPRWQIHKANWSHFEEITANSQSLPDPSNITLSVDEFTNLLTNAAHSSIPRTSGIIRPRQVPWWSQEIKSAIQDRKLALHAYERSRSQAAFIEYKKTRAKVRVLVRSSKKRSWISFISSINQAVPNSTMWSNIKRLTGNKSPKYLSQILINNQLITDPLSMSESFASHYAAVSSNENYDPSFLEEKIRAEAHPTQFHDDPSQPYNHPISETELQIAIQKDFKNSAPGPDEIHSAMLKHLHPNAFSYLLDLFNQILKQGVYPAAWKTAIIIPIPKPDSDPLCISSYRPIALTSVLGKTLEKILNKRLIWFLESNDLLSTYQYGFRKGRSTLHAMADLQAQVNEAFLSNSYCYSIFFDIKEAYPRVWRHYICQKLHELGLRGNLPKVIQDFLSNRNLVVRIQDQLSSPLTIENGVPQGSVLSVFLFLVAINDITLNTHFPLTQRLFADDYSVSIISANYTRALRLLQLTLDNLSKWAAKYGFRFSTTKTKVLVFSKKKPIPFLNPPLLLDGIPIPQEDSVKLLGLHFDQRMTWIPHIKLLKAKCLRTLNILRYISHQKHGCSRRILLTLYRSIVRSKLDYGSPIFNLAPQSTLKLLDPIHSAALRLITGASYTSPVISLSAEAAEPPLNFRRLHLTAGFLASSAQFTQLPIFDHLFNPQEISKFCTHKNRNIRLHFDEKLNFQPQYTPLSPIFTSTPPWLYTPPNIRYDLTSITKDHHPNVILSKLNSILEEFPDHTHCYTDGSRMKKKTACSFSVAGITYSFRLFNSASIFTAELVAILSCIQSLAQKPPSSKFLILTDSLSSLKACENPFSTHPLVQRILISLHTLDTCNISLTFIWVPAHIGIEGNETVDRAAKKATKFPKISLNIRPPAADLAQLYRTHIFENWSSSWKNQTQNNKLLKVKKDPIPWSTSNRKNRHEEIIIARLRIGHTRITHSYLLNNLPPPDCPKCQEKNLSADHLFSCPALTSLRHSFSVPPDRTLALKNDPPKIENTILYLRKSGLFPLI